MQLGDSVIEQLKVQGDKLAQERHEAYCKYANIYIYLVMLAVEM